MDEIKIIDMSICIPTFNRGRYLDYLLNYIYEHRDEIKFSYEIIISDNASVDDTYKIISKWKKKLPIKHYTQNLNIGAVSNVQFTFQKAEGEFCIYVADDDLVDFVSLNKCLSEFRLLNDVGVFFTPWKIGSIENLNNTKFYDLDKNLYIKSMSYLDLLVAILNFHIFPEIAIYRTEKVKILQPMTRQKIAFEVFSWATEWLGLCDVYFSKSSFYLSVIDHPMGDRKQMGHEQVKYIWDSYRGGLEVLLGKCVNLVEPDVQIKLREAINNFVAMRMAVAIKLRLAEKGDKIEIFLLASRLKGLGKENLLPIPFSIISANAALFYIFDELNLVTDEQNFILLGSYPEAVSEFIHSEFNIKNIQICDHISDHVNDAVILYKSDYTSDEISHFYRDDRNNLFISEDTLMKGKFS